jgi:hypothetical protein
MQYLGLGRWMKRDVNFDDILTVCDLIREADGTPFLNRVRYYKRVVGILTTGTGFLGGKVRWYHCKLIFRVLKAADMLSDEKIDYDPAQRILEFVNWLGPRLRISPKEILQNYNMQTLEGFYKEAISFNMRRDLSAALAQHTPTEFHKLISEIYEYKREEALTARNEEIAETENAPDRDPIRMLGNAFDIGG